MAHNILLPAVNGLWRLQLGSNKHSIPTTDAEEKAGTRWYQRCAAMHLGLFTQGERPQDMDVCLDSLRQHNPVHPHPSSEAMQSRAPQADSRQADVQTGAVMQQTNS